MIKSVKNGQNRQKPLIYTWRIWYFWTPFLKSYSVKTSKIALFWTKCRLGCDFDQNHPFFTFLWIFEKFQFLTSLSGILKKTWFFFSKVIKFHLFCNTNQQHWSKMIEKWIHFWTFVQYRSQKGGPKRSPKWSDLSKMVKIAKNLWSIHGRSGIFGPLFWSLTVWKRPKSHFFGQSVV